MAMPKSVCDNCVNSECVWRAPTGGIDPPVMVCPHKKEKPTTKADRIRAMTDEELAGFIGDDPMHDICPHDCFEDPDRPCKVCALKWLKEESE